MIQYLIFSFLFKQYLQVCLPGCLKCDSNDDCLLCDFTSNYYLHKGECFIFEMSDQCLHINLEGNCQECDKNYYLDAAYKCIAISNEYLVDYCEKYDKNMQCTLCEPNYYLNNNTCIVVDKLIDNCQYYTSNGICSECQKDYIISFDNLYCINIGNSFNECLNFTYFNCVKCQSGYIKNPNLYIDEFFNYNSSKLSIIQQFLKQVKKNVKDIQNTTVCQATTVSNCSTFISSDKCIECNTGYFLDSNYKCQEFPKESIINCLSYSSLTTCEKCVSGYILSSNNTCVALIQIENCNEYDPFINNLCLKCQSNYYLSNNYCILREASLNDSIYFCEEKDPYSDKCLTCMTGYILSLDLMECRKGVLNCLDHEYYLPSFEQIFCKKCISGYYLQDEDCVQGSDLNCQTFHQSMDYCIECNNMYYLTVNGDKTECKIQPYIEDCEIYDKTKKNFCNKCTEGKLNLVLDKICSFKKFIDYCISYREISGELLCIQCKSQYLLIDQQCIPNNIANCATQKLDSNQICEECTENFALFQIGDSTNSNSSISCVKPFQYQTLYCHNMIIVQDLSIMSQECQICKDYSINLDISESYACIETDYLKIYDLGLSVLDQFCLKYRGTECQLCEEGYYLQQNQGTQKCVENCEDNQALLAIQFNMVVSGNIKNYYVSKRNVCVEKVDNSQVIGISLNSSEVEYITIKCIEGSIQVIDLDETKYTNVDYNYHNQKWVNDIYEKNYRVSCPILTNEDYINGQQVDLNQNLQQLLIPNCSQYLKLDSHSYGCIQCKYGYSGVPSSSGKYYMKCQELVDCKNTHPLIGLENPYENLFSCNLCNSNETKPFLFLSNENNIFKPLRFTFDDLITFEYTGKTGTFQQNSLQCLTITTQSIAITLGVSQTNISLIDNCGLYFVDLQYPKEYYNQTIDEELQHQLIKCVACQPGYYKTEDSYISSCQVIENCEESNQRWFNSCSKCFDNYAYYIDQSTFQISFDKCVQAINNCFATQTENKCFFCQKGYFMNYDGYCELIDAPFCVSGNFTPFMQSQSLIYINYYQEFGNGCNKCSQDFLAIHVMTAKLPNLICFPSPYIKSNFDKVQNSTKYVQNCQRYEDSRFNSQNFTTKMICSQCIENYTINTSQQECVNVSEYQNCEIFNPEEFNCYQCKDQYGNVNGSCVKGTTINCKSYNTISQFSVVTCLACKDGYFLNNDNECIKGNVKNCLQYEGSENQCNMCDNDYFLVDTLYFNGTISYCLQKIQSLNCNDALILPHQYGARISCSTCSKNYGILVFPEEGDIRTKCVPVTQIENCMTYDIQTNLKNSSFKCIQCDENYYISSTGYSCIKRNNSIDNCQAYNISNDSCLRCEQGYFYSSTQLKCISYPKGIQNCISYVSNSQCSQCQQNYYLKKNECYFLQPSVRIANCQYYADQYTCSECEPNYFLASNSCTAVSINNCLEYEDLTICSKCEEGYGLVTNGNSMICQIVTKLNCFEIDQIKMSCKICDQGYYVDNQGNCQAANVINQCLTYTGVSTCSVCKQGYALSYNGQSCFYVQNQFDNNCKETQIVESIICSMCQPGYKLQDGDCIPQVQLDNDDGCFTRNQEDYTQCLLCNSGYFMKKDLACHDIIEISDFYVSISNGFISKLIQLVIVVFMLN